MAENELEKQDGYRVNGPKIQTSICWELSAEAYRFAAQLLS
jgi:hypothetical protein